MFDVTFAVLAAVDKMPRSLVNVNQTKRRHIPENSNLDSRNYRFLDSVHRPVF
jgi:hypothetical protein